MKKRSNEEDEETQREQRTDECIVGGTHQLNRTIMFPAEVSTPAAQVLRGRAVTTQTHGQTHGLSVLHHTTQTSINWDITRTQVAVAASAFLQSFLSHFVLFFMATLFTLCSFFLSFFIPFPFSVFPFLLSVSLLVWRGWRWHGDWPGATDQPSSDWDPGPDWIKPGVIDGD